MNRFLCSTIIEGIVSSPGALLVFEERGIRLKGFLAYSMFLEYDHIERVVYSKVQLRAKIISTGHAFTIITFFIGAFLTSCSQHGIKLERHTKAEHNSNRSNYRFWHYR
jgi:hypothetical protein